MIPDTDVLCLKHTSMQDHSNTKALLRQFPLAHVTDVEECITQSDGHLGHARIKLRRLFAPTLIDPKLIQLAYLMPPGYKPRQMGRLCEMCSLPTSTMCSRCQVVYYCSNDCRDKDRKNHKKLCCNSHAVALRRLITSHRSVVFVQFTVIQLSKKLFWRASVTTTSICMTLLLTEKLTLSIAQRLIELSQKNMLCPICMNADVHVLCHNCAQGMCGKCYIELFRNGKGLFMCPFCRKTTGQVISNNELMMGLQELHHKLLWSTDTLSTVQTYLSSRCK